MTRTFYRVYRHPSAGFFKFFSFLRHTAIACQRGAIPFVDFSGVEMNYRQVSGSLEGTEPWQYFFEQPLSFRKAHFESGDEIVDCGGHHPNPGEPINPYFLSSVWRDEFDFNAPTRSHLESQVRSLEIGEDTLGILLRGLDMKTSPSHHLPPTIRQVRKAAEIAFSTGEFQTILLVTESLSYSILLRRLNGVRVTSSPSRKILMTWQRTKSFRTEHGFRSGLEVLTDAYLLSRCGGLIYSGSNISMASILFRDKPLSSLIEIDNGLNVKGWIQARFYWFLRACIPEFLGGFGTKGIVNKSLKGEPEPFR